MMASGQACLITLFFKTPQEVEENRESTASESEPLIVQSDCSSSEDGNDCYSDEELSGKPLVLNLCGLLNTSKKKNKQSSVSDIVVSSDDGPRTTPDIASVPKERTSEDEGSSAVPNNALKQSVLSWDTKSGRLVLGALEDSGGTQSPEEDSGEDCTGTTERVEGQRMKRKSQAVRNMSALKLEGFPLQCEDDITKGEVNDNDGCEGFVEGKRCRKMESKPAHGTAISVDSSTEGEINEVMPPKRSRRSAAISATKRITSRRRSTRLRRSPQGEIESHVMEPDSRNVTITESEQGNMLKEIDALSDGEVVEDSIVFISSAAKTALKHPLQQTSVARSGSLSAEWSKIFRQPSKSKQPDTEVIELSTTEDESAIDSPKPEQKQGRKLSPGNRSRWCGSMRRSPSNSPRRCGIRNRSNSPRSPRRNSPIPSPRRNSPKHSGSSPLKESLLSKRQLLFSRPTKNTGVYYDSAPFTGLVHVQQRQSGERFWELEAPTPVIPLRGAVSGVRSPCGSLGVCSDLYSNERKATPQIHVCSEEEKHRILRQLGEAYPLEEVAAIFKRYERITRGNGEESGEAKKESPRNDSSKSSTTCSIKICTVKDTEKIRVDSAAYEKRRLRHSRRRSSKSKVGKTNKKKEQTSKGNSSSNDVPRPFQSELWTEIYRPRQSSDIIGNREQVMQFHLWLDNWRTRCYGQTEAHTRERTKCYSQTEAHTHERNDKKPQRGAARVMSSVPWWVSEQEDNDFVSLEHVRRKRSYVAPCCPGDSDGEEEEGDTLAPVMLMCGGHGCGKTAAVYACAEELGFKVLEVNSTTVRSRQTVLSILREATLSHQVVTHSQGVTADHVRETTSSCREGASEARKEPSGGLYSFFKPKKVEEKLKKEPHAKEESTKGGKREGRDGVNSEPQTKRRRKSSVITISSSDELPVASTSSVALAKATVILLEEVDILFEEDKGFWSAVYEIIAATKRPIIMTCSDTLCDLDCDHEKLVFTQPSMLELSLHMQLLSLAHGGHMTSTTANQIALFLSRDIRKVMNCLQFWLSALPRGSAITPQVLCPEERDVPAGDSAVSLEHLLGLSAEERDLLKTLQQPNTPERKYSQTVLCDTLEMIHQAGLDLTSTLGVHTHPSEERTSLSMPWRYPHKINHSSPKYHTLDTLSNQCDDLSYMDTMRSCDSHVTKNVYSPWWQCEPDTDLSDQLPLSDHNASISQTTCRIRTALEALTRLGGQGGLLPAAGGGELYGLAWQEKERRRVEMLHSAHQQCSEVFGLHSELSHSAMTLDCLPALQLICQSENFRQDTNVKRRFRHYMQSSIVDIPVLKSFARRATFSSELEHS